MKYYVKIKIIYVDYGSVGRGVLVVRREFDVSQESLRDTLTLTIENLYRENEGCDIISVEVLENALF